MCLKGIQAGVTLKMILGDQVKKLLKKGGKGVFGCLFMISGIESKEQKPVAPELEDLLQHYSTVFEDPKGLPPVRSQDHKIVLK